LYICKKFVICSIKEVSHTFFIMQKTRGKFIVIDGTDGSGKATQTQLLVERLSAAGYGVVMADFPQYGKRSAGLVEQYLNGTYGNAEEVGPYRASIFYAVDRYDASFQIRRWLIEGKIVISNRYVTANMAHQGGKIKDRQKRREYFKWLFQLEYGLFNIPRPDLNIILHVDAAIAQKLVDKKGIRSYLKGEKRDIHEADINHLREAEKVYLEIARSFSDCELVECTAAGRIMPRQKINDLIWESLRPKLNLAVKKSVKTEYAEEEENIENLIRKAYPMPAEKPVEITAINPPVTDIRNIDSKPRILTKKYSAAPFPAREITASQNIIKIQKITPDAKLPVRAHTDDAGLDLYANDYYTLYEGERAIIGTGIALAVPEGYAGLIWDKGGLAANGLKTAGGVIDSGYRGEIKVVVINLSGDIYHIAKGQKIAQILIQEIKKLELREVGRLDETGRGMGGFGSSGI